GALQMEIGDRMLEHEDRDRNENDEGELRHGLFAERFCGPVPVGRGRVLPEERDALAVKRVELVEARGVDPVAVAAKRFRRIPILGAITIQERAMAFGEIAECARVFERAIAEKGKDARGLGLALHLQEIELEKGKV